MSCNCRDCNCMTPSWCGDRRCCKKDKLSYTELLASISECDTTEWEILVYNQWTYCKVNLSSIFWDWTLSWDSLDITWNADFWWNVDVAWNLDVDWTTTLDDLVVDGRADFNEVVDFTWATLIFDEWELCDEVNYCILNDEDVRASITAIVNWSTSSFWCEDLPACISWHAWTKSAIESLIQSYLDNNWYVAWGSTWWWTELCSSTSDTWSYISSSLENKNWVRIIFWNGWEPTSTASYVSTETWYMVFNAINANSNSSWWFRVLVNGNEVWSSWSINSAWDYSIPLWLVNVWDTIVIENNWGNRDVSIREASLSIAVESCWKIAN